MESSAVMWYTHFSPLLSNTHHSCNIYRFISFFSTTSQDYWDSLKNNEYFSMEGLVDLIKQVSTFFTVYTLFIHSKIQRLFLFCFIHTASDLQDSRFGNTQISDTQKNCNLWGLLILWARYYANSRKYNLICLITFTKSDYPGSKIQPLCNC